MLPISPRAKLHCGCSCCCSLTLHHGTAAAPDVLLQMFGSPDKRFVCLGPCSGFSDHYGARPHVSSNRRGVLAQGLGDGDPEANLPENTIVVAFVGSRVSYVGLSIPSADGSCSCCSWQTLPDYPAGLLLLYAHLLSLLTGPSFHAAVSLASGWLVGWCFHKVDHDHSCTAAPLQVTLTS